MSTRSEKSAALEPPVAPAVGFSANASGMLAKKSLTSMVSGATPLAAEDCPPVCASSALVSAASDCAHHERFRMFRTRREWPAHWNVMTYEKASV